MKIEFAHGQDVAPLLEAYAELFAHYFGDQAPPRETLRANLLDGVFGAHSGVRVVQVFDAAEVAAFATVSLVYPAPGAKGQLFMKDLFVRARWRGRGVGEALMLWLARHAIEQGCVRFDWTTERTNAGALAFYGRLGAKRVEEKVYFRLAGAELEAFAKTEAARR